MHRRRDLQDEVPDAGEPETGCDGFWEDQEACLAHYLFASNTDRYWFVYCVAYPSTEMIALALTLVFPLHGLISHNFSPRFKSMMHFLK